MIRGSGSKSPVPLFPNKINGMSRDYFGSNRSAAELMQ
jgi:hypothetical protein